MQVPEQLFLKHTVSILLLKKHIAINHTGLHMYLYFALFIYISMHGSIVCVILIVIARRKKNQQYFHPFVLINPSEMVN